MHPEQVRVTENTMPNLSTVSALLAGAALAAFPLHAQDAPADQAAPAEAIAGSAEEVSAAYDASTVLATVNDAEITLGHVVALRERLPEQFQGLPDETLMQGLIDQLIDQILLAETVSEDPENDPPSVRLHLDNERRGNLAQIAVRERAGQDVSDEAVQQAYDALVAAFEPQTEWNASHIIVQSEEEATALLAEIEGGADFAETAQEHSQDGAAERGGSLGWFSTGMMVPEFETAVAEMEEGEVRGPLRTQFGWHLVRLNETRETQPPELDQVRSQLVDQVRQERLMAEVQALRDDAEIERINTEIPPQAVRDSSIISN
jgi:peptidyl-prolyl cis-trans isomerase C